MLREAMPEYVYVNGLRKKSITLKDGDIFAIDRTKMAETFVFVLGMVYARLNSGINWFHREMSSIGMPLPDYGIIDIGERFLYEYVIQDGAPLVLNRIPWTEENAQLATAWREHINEQVKSYQDTGVFTWDANAFWAGLKDYLHYYDTITNGRAANPNAQVGALAQEDLQGASTIEAVLERRKNNSQTLPNIWVQDELNFSGMTREGDSAMDVLNAHLQSRRDAMPKMGLEAARANV